MTIGRDLIPIAWHWFRLGVISLPLYGRSKRPTLRWGDIENPTWRDIAEWFDTGFQRNLGLFVGKRSGGLVVLDFDKPLPYFVWKRAHADVASTYTVKTRRGFHVYLRLTALPNTPLSMWGGDVKSSGYVVAPPSIHPSGAQYRALDEDASIMVWRGSLGDLGVTQVSFLQNISVQTDDDLRPMRTTGRVNGGLVDHIKRTVSISDVLPGDLIPSGSDGWYMCLCPFHQDRNPSMWVNLQAGLCRCFNPACPGHDRVMDVINLWGKLHGYENGRAVIQMARSLGII